MSRMSREEAIKMLKSKMDGHTDTSYEWCETVRMAIEALSQEPCDDAISRDAALEKMADYVASGYADSEEDFLGYSRIICQLPPVRPKSETVTEFADRCRECGAKYGKLLKQKSGKWIEMDGYDGDVYYDCSERKPCINYSDGCEEWAGCPCVYYKAESEE